MATTTDTLIGELKIKDSWSKEFDAWDRHIKQMEKDWARVTKTFNTPSFSRIPSILKTSLVSPFLGAFNLITGAAAQTFTKIGTFAKDIFKDAVSDSISLEDALSGVRRTANLTESQVGILMEKVRDLSTEELRGAVSAQNLGEILEVAGQRGELAGEKFEQTLQGALKFTEHIALASTALDLSFSKTADALGKLQGPYGQATVEVGFLANAINVLADSTKAAAPQIIQIAQKAAPALAAFRVGQSDLLGLSAAMDALGVTAYTSSTALQSAFKAMTSNTSAFAVAFGIDARRLNQLVQTDIVGAFTLLLKHVQKMATETPGGVQKVTQALKDLRISGAGVSTAILGLAGLGTELQTKFLDPAKEGITNMNSINAEFINSISKVEQIWAGLKTIWANTAGVISDQLLPLMRDLLLEIHEGAVAFRSWLKETDFVTRILPEALDSLKVTLTDMVYQAIEFVKNINWKSVGQSLKEIAQGAKNFAMSLGDALRNGDLNTIIDSVEGLAGSLQFVLPVLKFLKEGFGRLSDQIKTFRDLTMPVFQAVVDIIVGTNDRVTAIIDTFKNLGKVTVEIFSKIVGWIKGPVVNALVDFGQKIADVTKKILGLGKEAYQESVFPDISDWLTRNKNDVQALGAELVKVTGRLKAMESTTKSGLMLGMSGAAMVRAPIDMMGAQSVKTQVSRSVAVAAAPTPKQPTVIQNVSFVGQNVIDESSKNRFVREIIKTSAHINGARIRG